MLPYPITEEIDINDETFTLDNRDDLIKLSRQRAYLCNKFNNMWKLEYLTALREKHSSHGSEKVLVKKGQVCLIHDEKSPRLSWKLGVILELHTSKDGLTRYCTLKTQNGFR